MKGSSVKTIGLALLVLGTVVASLGGARLPEADHLVSGVGVAMLVGGLVAMRLAARTAAGDAQAERGGEGDPLALLRGLPEQIAPLREQATTLELPRLVDAIGEVVRRHFSPLSENAPSLLPRLGPDLFSRVLGPYARAERSIARAWSAASDGHREESVASLDQAHSLLAEALKELEAGSREARS